MTWTRDVCVMPETRNGDGCKLFPSDLWTGFGSLETNLEIDMLIFVDKTLNGGINIVDIFSHLEIICDPLWCSPDVKEAISLVIEPKSLNELCC